jgi:GT2 family glycosyltransferase
VTSARSPRPVARGKFFEAGGEKLTLRGVTYGTFQETDDERQGYPERHVVARDFVQMAENGINTVRTYTVPPRWMLDAALGEGLRVLVGLPWEQHVTFLDNPGTADSIDSRVREGVRACAGHPAVFGYAVGNEIPAPIVRWHGRKPTERFLRRLYRSVKQEDPEALVTYVNYPTTEYLELPFFDFACFNVYLEDRESLEAYLGRLQNLADERPLVMAEIGLDSRRNGEDEQAQVLDWQLRTISEAGCAGTFVFAWTDEWARGGHEIEDWDFGLTRRDRSPKPALAAVAEAYVAMPVQPAADWPRVSVVVCTYNGSSTLPECLDSILGMRYPNFEVILVDDGSTDGSADLARSYGVKVITTENQGLGSARNSGLHEATGEIVAYTDDDAYPDPEWLTYLALCFRKTSHAAVGGPNIPPHDAGPVADCVANAPGGATHVLLSDQVAEHLPGCNMAFRKESLDEIGGFDPQFRAAGDDVDVCWQLQDRGWTLGYSAAAMVWHHRRGSVRRYWKQQLGYGRAEALVERKWPEKYNRAGHVSWAGRIYGKGLAWPLGKREGRVFHGTWGSALFQRLYHQPSRTAESLPLMPEWYLVLVALGVVSALGLLWSSLLIAAPVFVVALGALVAQAGVSAKHATYTAEAGSLWASVRLRGLTGGLYLIQPLARLVGRIGHGLTPWRRRPEGGWALPRVRESTAWCEEWHSLEDRLRGVEADLIASGAAVGRGGDFDRWDLEVRGGPLATIRVRTTVEEHGGGQQLVRLRSWPRFSPLGVAVILIFGGLAAAALSAGGWISGLVLAALAGVVAARMAAEAAAASDWSLRPHSGEQMRRRMRGRSQPAD